MKQKGEQKYDRHYERLIRERAKERISAGKFHLLDIDARLLGRQNIEGVGKNCLVGITREGEVFVMDEYFELHFETIKNQRD